MTFVLAWPKCLYHVLNVTSYCLFCTMKLLVIGLLMSTVYNCPKYVTEKMIFPSGVFTQALPPPKVTYSPFESSFNTEIRFDLNPGVCNALLKIIFLWAC